MELAEYKAGHPIETLYSKRGRRPESPQPSLVEVDEELDIPAPTPVRRRTVQEVPVPPTPEFKVEVERE